MTYYRLKSDPSRSAFILQKSNYAYINPTPQPQDYKPRPLSKIGSDSYNRSLRRAFSRAKLLAFFNPDLTQFITLTYHQNLLDPTKVIQDIKNLITLQTKLTLQSPSHPTYTTQSKKRENPSPPDGSPDLNSPTRGMKPSDQDETREPQSSRTTQPTITEMLQDSSLRTARASSSRGGRNKKDFKYVYVMEKQKRGAIHVHMIANDWLKLERINGHDNVVGWGHGFSEVLTIRNFDNNFKPYLYLFKYMQKAQRVGKSFIHVSRNFDKINVLDYDNYIHKLEQEHLLFTEDHQFELNDKLHTITKEYYRSPQVADSKEKVTI